MKNEFLMLTDKDYHETMIAIYDLMNKGEMSLTAEELGQLRIMALAAERYEDETLHLKPVQ